MGRIIDQRSHQFYYGIHTFLWELLRRGRSITFKTFERISYDSPSLLKLSDIRSMPFFKSLQSVSGLTDPNL